MKEGVDLLKVFAYMWQQPNKIVECKEVIIREGAKFKIDGEETQMLAVIVADEILHPVVSVEVL